MIWKEAPKIVQSFDKWKFGGIALMEDKSKLAKMMIKKLGQHSVLLFYFYCPCSCMALNHLSPNLADFPFGP
jgi:hypothetical protein